MADLHEANFRWPRTDASDVIVTGTFDQWSCSIHLNKSSSDFETTVKIPWSDKILYKFVVDGRWTTADEQPTEYDSAGNLNNVYLSPSKPEPPVMEAPPAVLAPQAVEAEVRNGESQGNGTIVEKVTQMAGSVAEMAGNAVTPVMKFADKFVDDDAASATPSPTEEAKDVVSPIKSATPASPPLPSPSEAPLTPKVLPEVPIPIVPIMEPATVSPAASPSPSSPAIPPAPTIPPPEPLETLIVAGSAVGSEHKTEAGKDEAQPSTHTGVISDVIEPSPAQLTEPAPATPTEPSSPPKANGINGSGSPTTTTTTEPKGPPVPEKPTSPALGGRTFSFPSIIRKASGSTTSIPRSSSPTPSNSPGGTVKFKGSERKKRNSLFGKIKDVLGANEKEKPGN